MIHRAFFIGGLTAAAIAGFACSGSTQNGLGGASCFLSQDSAACTSCLEQNCSSEASAVNGSCSDYIACVCPGGTLDTSKYSTCQGKITASCSQAEGNGIQCQSTHCASQCGGSGGSGGGSSSGIGSSSGTGSSSGGTVGSCLASSTSSACASCVETQCSSQLDAVGSGCVDYLACACPGGIYDPTEAAMQACQAKASEASCSPTVSPLASCEQSACSSPCNLGSSSSSGGGSGSSSGTTTTTTFACTTSSTTYPTCTEYKNVPTSSLASYMSACTGGQGTSSTTCSTAGLVGCCTYANSGSISSESCYYDPSITSSVCTNGTWSTAP